MEITSFAIKKLHGKLDYELKLKNNTLILIGENGSCKTTIIKMLFYTLSMQWSKLSQYNFKSVTIQINEHAHTITKTDINTIAFFDESFIRRFPAPIRNELRFAQTRGRTIDIEKIESLCRRYGFPVDYILRELDIESTFDFFSESEPETVEKHAALKHRLSSLKSALKDTCVLYLPTYRRIEQDLKVVLGRDIDEQEYRSKRSQNNSRNNAFTELVEFGMSDVNDAINRTLNTLKDFFRDSLNSLTLGYLGDVVEEKYRNVDVTPIKNADDDTIHNIMNRVDEKILSTQNKSRLLTTLREIRDRGIISEHDRVVCHYFIKLLNSHSELEKKEIQIRKFGEVCGKYLENKNVRYDSSNFTFSIMSNIDNQPVELYQLSSGEKQIVSLFSQLYLSEQNQYFVLIDEPELSLSVKWQKHFLVDVRSSGFCNGLIAVTHSPFIFDNELDKYARGIGEFN